MDSQKEKQLQRAIQTLANGVEPIADVCTKLNIKEVDVRKRIGELQAEKTAKDAKVFGIVYGECKKVWEEYGDVALEVFQTIINEQK
jgi:hypothetical protein